MAFQIHNENECNLLKARGFILNQLRRNNQLCDVCLNINGTKINAHRIVLAASSDYFSSMFSVDLAERNQNQITIHNLTATAVELIVEFFYTACSVVIDFDNVTEVMAAASLLLVKEVFADCISFLSKNSNESSVCLAAYYLADLYSLPDLKDSASETIRRYFTEVAAMPDFLSMSLDLLVPIVSNDNLNCLQEEEVFEVIRRWISHDETSRKPLLLEIMKHVRLNLIQRDYLANNVLPFCRDDDQCCSLVNNAIEQFGLADQQARFGWDVLFAVSSRAYWVKEGFKISPVGEWKQSSFPEAMVHITHIIDGTVMEGKVYLLAMVHSSVYKKQLLVYSHENKAVTFGPALPLDDDVYVSVAACSGRLYLLGYDSTSEDSFVVRRYNTQGNNWSQVAESQVDVDHPSKLFSIDDNLGWIHDDSSRRVQSYRYKRLVRRTQQEPDQPITFAAFREPFRGKLMIVERGSHNPDIGDPTLTTKRPDPNIVEAGRQLYNVSDKQYVKVYDPVREKWTICGSSNLPPSSILVYSITAPPESSWRSFSLQGKQ